MTKFASISHASTLGSFVTAVGFWRWCHRSCTTQMDPADGSKAVSAEIRRFCGAPGWTTEGVRVSKHQKSCLLVLSDASLAWPPAEQGGRAAAAAVGAAIIDGPLGVDISTWRIDRDIKV